MTGARSRGWRRRSRRPSRGQARFHLPRRSRAGCRSRPRPDAEGVAAAATTAATAGDVQEHPPGPAVQRHEGVAAAAPTGAPVQRSPSPPRPPYFPTSPKVLPPRKPPSEMSPGSPTTQPPFEAGGLPAPPADPTPRASLVPGSTCSKPGTNSRTAMLPRSARRRPRHRAPRPPVPRTAVPTLHRHLQRLHVRHRERLLAPLDPGRPVSLHDHRRGRRRRRRAPSATHTSAPTDPSPRRAMRARSPRSSRTLDRHVDVTARPLSVRRNPADPRRG